MAKQLYTILLVRHTSYQKEPNGPFAARPIFCRTFQLCTDSGPTYHNCSDIVSIHFVASMKVRIIFPDNAFYTANFDKITGVYFPTLQSP